MRDHTYRTTISWAGSTGAGIRHFSRTHRAVVDPGIELEVTADPHFRGDPDRLNPEQLLVLAASSCQLLSFLGAAARAGVDVLSYEDQALGTMPVTRGPMSITEIRLRPRIGVAAGTDHEQVRELVEEGHRNCFIANSLNSRIEIDPSIETAADDGREG
ncbi:OsmC family protein [Ornithinicoccus halotolerans]|uniref:OsmC family protein n=1 Tax=Ornithinicoccus halotolerans TaxID=1748220 RepID=UPI001296AAFB|nr:OsmC family protein [Ornithinicoccus halotolerans]